MSPRSRSIPTGSAQGLAPGPQRTCIGCRRVAPAAELVRVTRQGDGSLAVGPTLPGRGAWLCQGSATCFDAAQRRGAFARALRAPVADAALVAVRNQVIDRADAPQERRKG